MIRARYVAHIRRILLPKEVIEFTAQQRRIVPGGALLTPRIIVGTNTRLIIFKREVLGVSEDFDVIPYNRITHVKLNDGIFSSSIIIGVLGHTPENPQSGRGSIEIGGIRDEDAIELIRFLDRILVEEETVEHFVKGRETEHEIEGRKEIEVTCKTCGTRNSVMFNYCEHCGAHL